MPERGEMVELILPATNRYLQVARLTVSGVASRAGLTIEDIEAMKLAVGEACTNAVEHAYASQPGETCLRIRCGVQGREFVVEVTDEGKGFDLEAVDLDTETPPAPEAGLGFFLIRSSVDRLDVDSAPGGGTKVIMAKRLPK
ncbi:MAG: ATP-binding protein [Armatimonadota bacterium]